MTFEVSAILSNALVLFDDRFVLTNDLQIEGGFGKDKADYAVELTERTVLTGFLFESEETTARMPLLGAGALAHDLPRMIRAVDKHHGS